MNAFVRRIAALSVLWSLCELLLPEGGGRRAVRMTVSLLVMMALVSGVSELLGNGALPQVPSESVWAQGATVGGYDRVALRSIANQARRYCERMGEKAGYRASAAVYLQANGALERVELWLTRREDVAPLITEQAVADSLAQALETDPARILLMGDSGS